MGAEADDADGFARDRLDSLRRFAYLVCGSAAEADDLAQVAVVEVWRRWESVRTDPEAYARRVIVTRNISRWRRWWREVPSVLADRDGEDPARRRVTDPALWDALHALGQPERTVVVLHVLFRYTFDEIAAMSGEPRGTVSSRYSRALRALRRHLSARAGAEPDHDWLVRLTP
ncbi:DNA-directed RNA polymerase sigma-70 factor [Amorphoplanes nipponensis]|uniref:DNA-directed RNA polymerase sigma-70 factor n=1 Tax=Actinoplanes nipponensis TaxID=135950 RepID=A0A919JGQ1_9ACTN|nr:sigma-70 family RNA polymerase sigma factor [Actinoplanes nipponensis]GIE50684.1 DNA-directed RNA polymerase sigma-70 factor [Actinoplanes nipponensis]